VLLAAPESTTSLGNHGAGLSEAYSSPCRWADPTMGKYRGRTNEERRAKNQRQVVECCELPQDGRDFLEQAAEILMDGQPIDTKHKDRGPAAKIHALLSGSSTSAQSAALKALGAPRSILWLSPTLT
jgi:hypothetical protein